MGKIKSGMGIILTFKNWVTYFLDHFGFLKSKSVIYTLRSGVKYKTRTGTHDKFIINEICFYKFYTPPGFELKEKDIVVDIGAQTGIFSIFASNFVKNGKVFAFEPIPENFELIKENIKLNKASNIIPINKGVSGKTERREIILCDNNTGGHSLFKFAYNKNCSKKLKINTISLNDFIVSNKLRTIDFLKIDCEGAEYEILFSLTKKNLEKIKKISMEHHTISDKRYKDYNVQNLKAFLIKNGFDVSLNKNMLYAKKN